MSALAERIQETTVPGVKEPQVSGALWSWSEASISFTLTTVSTDLSVGYVISENFKKSHGYAG